MRRLVGGTSGIVALLAGLATSAARGDEPTLAEEAAFRAAVARVAAAIVRLEPLGLSTEALASGEAAPGTGPSTGLVVAAGRVLATEFAVPADVKQTVVVTADGRRLAGQVLGRDASRGLVLLAAEGLADPPPLEPVPRADLRPGQWAIVAGRGWTSTSPNVSVGVVSALNRAWGRAVQTDAAVSPVNYGGPLLDIAGRVIGIVVPLPADTAGMTEGTELYDAGIGFAVPLEDVRRVLPRLEAGETLAPGILGIGYRDRDPINGAPVIGSVRQGSPAARAGLEPGDRIVAIDGGPVNRIADARHRIAPRYAGETIRVAVERKGNGGAAPARLEVEATLVDRLPGWRRAVVGLVCEPRADDVEGPVRVAWVLPDGPAAAAGVRPGDAILSIAPAAPGAAVTPIDSIAAAGGALAGIEPAGRVRIVLGRDGDERPIDLATVPMPGDVPPQGPPPPAPADLLAGPAAAVEVVRLSAADEANPALAVIPRGEVPIGALVWFGPPSGPTTEAEAGPWKTAAASHGIAVVLPGSADERQWSPDDLPAVARALAALATRRPLDRSRLAVAGTGAGGAFAWLVAERLDSAAGGVAIVGGPLPRRAAIEPAEPGRSRWVLLGPGRDDEARDRVAGDRTRLERAGFPVGILPAADDAPPTDLLCRWASLLGLL